MTVEDIYYSFQKPDFEDLLALDKLTSIRPWFPFQWEGYLQRKQYEWIIAEYEGRLVAAMVFYVVIDEVHVSNVMVHPNAQCLGIGARLFTLMFQELKARQVTSCILEVRASNIPAQRLYQKLGFELLSLRKDYYHTPTENALVLKKDL